ncbi:MAG: protein translocase subunit SecF [Candidatus Woesearchaeota archaeon]
MSAKKKQKKSNQNNVNKNKKDSFFYGLYKNDYKKLLLIPFFMLILALILIGHKYAVTGDFFNKGISLSGGVTVTAINENLDGDEIRSILESEFPGFEINTRSINEAGVKIGLSVESNILPEDEDSDLFVDRVKELTQDQDASVESIGASLGDAFFRQTGLAMLVAFIFMGLVVFAYFRALVPSAAVILAAFSNIVVTIAILNLMNYNLGTAGIAALLMLIGYSVDTDILLTTRLLKEDHSTTFERLIGAMKTGLTMSVTTLLAATVTFIVAQSAVLREIIMIIMIGLIVDLINTWLQNAGILRWYMEKKWAN